MKLRWPDRLFLDSEPEGYSPATRKGLALTGFSGNATMPEPDGGESRLFPEFVAVGVMTLQHCLRFMSGLAGGIEHL